MRILTRKEFQDDMAKMWSEAVEAECKALIEAAVLAEREACAQIVNDDRGLSDDDAIRVCRKIRARGNT